MEKILKLLKTLLEKNKTELNALLEKKPSVELTADITAQRDQVTELLSKLPTIEQAGAQDGTLVQSLTLAFESLQNGITRIFEKMDKLIGSNNTAVSELNGFKEKVEKKLLYSVEEHNNLLQAARVKWENEELSGTRGKIVELAGLPAAPANVLTLPATEFNARIDQAKANITALGKRGLKIGGKGDGLVKDIAWKNVTEFNAYVEMHKDVLPAETAGAGTPDPLCAPPAAGAGAGTGAAGAGTNRKALPV